MLAYRGCSYQLPWSGVDGVEGREESLGKFPKYKDGGPGNGMKLGGECRHHPNRKKTNQFVVSWSWWPPHQLNTFLKMKPFLIQKIPPCHLSELPQKVRDCLVATQFSAILIWANQNNFSYNSQTRIRTLYFGGIPFLNYHMLHHLDSFGPKMASLIGICPEFVDTENWRSFRIFALTPKCLTNKIPRKEQALPHCIHHFLRSFFFKATFFFGGHRKGGQNMSSECVFFSANSCSEC